MDFPYREFEVDQQQLGRVSRDTLSPRFAKKPDLLKYKSPSSLYRTLKTELEPGDGLIGSKR